MSGTPHKDHRGPSHRGYWGTARRDLKLWTHRDKDVKHFVKSFPRGLPPMRGEHHPDRVNQKVVCAWLRDRPRPKLTTRIRLKLARMNIKAQVRNTRAGVVLDTARSAHMCNFAVRCCTAFAGQL